MAAKLRPPPRSLLVPPLKSKPLLRALATVEPVDSPTVDTPPPATTPLTTAHLITSLPTTVHPITDMVTEEESVDVEDTSDINHATTEIDTTMDVDTLPDSEFTPVSTAPTDTDPMAMATEDSTMDTEPTVATTTTERVYQGWMNLKLRPSISQCLR